MIRTVFVWLGGVLTASIPQATADALPVRLAGNAERRGKLIDLADRLTLGHIAAPTFCQRAVQVCNSPQSGEELERSLQRRMGLREAVLQVLRELPGDLSVWLVSDYPSRWLSSIDHASGLWRTFRGERILVTEELGLPRMVPEIFPLLVERAAMPKDRCLLVDSATSRAVEAIRHGIPAVIYVDPTRLRREFVLRRMVPPPPGFVFPVGFRPMD